MPLFFVGLGSDRPLRELKLSDLLVDDVVFVDDLVHFRFKLTGTRLRARRSPSCSAQEGKPDVLAAAR